MSHAPPGAGDGDKNLRAGPRTEVEAALVTALARRLSLEDARELCRLLETPGGRKMTAVTTAGSRDGDPNPDFALDRSCTPAEKAQVDAIRESEAFVKFLHIILSPDYMKDLMTLFIQSPSFRDLHLPLPD